MSRTTPLLSTSLAALFLGASLPAQALQESAAGATMPSGDQGAKTTAMLLLSESSEDPVVASFARMIGHAPSHHVPPSPAATSPDPLMEAVVLPLVRSNREQLARSQGRPGHI